jgi:hypothetical protein
VLVGAGAVDLVSLALELDDSLFVVDSDLLELESDLLESEEDSLDFDSPPSFFDSLLSVLGVDAPLVAERESVTYQPLPLKTMPTGWITLRRVPPHCSQVVSGASEKLCRRSMVSAQLVQV